jgi:hypothetical protein
MSNPIQMFYRGGDNGLWTRWLDSGTWSDEASLGGTLTTQPVAAIIPGTDILQVFYGGGDNALWTRWLDLDSGAYWSDEQRLGGFLIGNPVAAVIPGTDTLQLFYRGGDSGLWTRWLDSGTWSDEQPLGGNLTSDPVAYPIPGTDILQLFYRGADNALWTRWRDPAATPNWSHEQRLGGVLSWDPAVAQIPGTDILQVFYRGGDSVGLWTRWRDPAATPNWSDEQPLGGHLTSNLLAVALPGTDIVQVFYRGADDGLWTRWRDPAATPNWSDEQSLGGILTGAPVAAVIPGTDILQLFYLGGDSGLWTRWRDPAATPNWSHEQRLGGVLTGAPVATAPLRAVSPVNWMRQVSGDRLLSTLTLPGTHESCTAGLTEAASCQNWDLATQLQYGIRYVDIRCRQIQDVFAIHHGDIYVGFNFGEGVRDVCVDFLKANPSECIVMQIKWHEADDFDNQLKFQQVFDGYVQGFEDFFYRDDHIPTLGEVRGKIVVVRRFDPSPATVEGLNLLDWKDNTTFDVNYKAQNGEAVTFHIQDQYNVSDPGLKWPPVKALLDRATVDKSAAWYINFASGTAPAAIVFPDGVAGIVNPQLYDYLAGRRTTPPTARLGTLMLDFPDPNMIGRIIALNT